MDLEIKAPPEIVAAFQGARRTGGGFFETLCPNCAGGHRRRKKTLRAGFLHGKPWWGCMRCECHKEYAAARRTEYVRFQYSSEQAAQDEKQIREWALRIWERSSIVKPGDPVDRYLREQRNLRPLKNAWPETLHYARIKHSHTKRTYDGMVAVVHSEFGMFMGIHRTFLLEDGRRADSEDVPQGIRVDDAKMTAGSILGGAIRLGVDPLADTIGVAEGIESALAFSLVLGFPCWSTVSAAGMHEVRISKEIRRVLVGFDVDPLKVVNGRTIGRAGFRAAMDLRKRLIDQADKEQRRLVVDLKPPPLNEGDWADWFVHQQKLVAG